MGAASVVTSVAELTQALASGQAEIEVRGELTGMPMVTLGPGVSLRGGTLRFGAKGVRLTSGNLLESITVLTEDDEVAILNDTTIADLGRSRCATCTRRARCCSWPRTRCGPVMSRSRA